ncbi:CRTAC1 family protein [Lewinella sp. IMCC34191]|uniref:CRTAC1 family protein n=1 Tax=Lewinella sp. IMCC34191 TaxID=2259172 RepID=UPI000E26817E|nr:CRTAC1 family protein [Lewinella sp. IMCC34191]
MGLIDYIDGRVLCGGAPVLRVWGFVVMSVVGFVNSAPGQQPFRDATAGSGIDARGRGRGAAVCDVNADGHPDLYLCMLDGPNRLYVNDGAGHFEEMQAEGLAGNDRSMVSLWADFDNDGDEDVLIGNQDEPTRLYEREGDGFLDETPTSGINLVAKVQAGSVLDFDGDGKLDIYLTCLNEPNRLYRNLGGLVFSEVAAEAGVAVTGLNMQSLATDYDRDGDPDLYVVRDGSQPNVLLRNDGGRFTDVSMASGADVVGEGMGVDAADYDRDGDLDLYVTNLYDNYLLENLGNGTFRERGFDARVNDLGMGWGTVWLDYDLDGLPDLYVANETGFSVGNRRYNNVLYHNDGGRFATVRPDTAAFHSSHSSYGAVTADFNGDGRPDLYVANSGQSGQLFLNTADDRNHWVGFDLYAGDRYAIGASVDVWIDGRRRSGEVRAGGSFASQHERTLRFGLGTSDRVDSLIIHWPGGDIERYQDMAADRRYMISPGSFRTTAVLDNAISLNVYPNPVRDGELHFGQVLHHLRLYDPRGVCVFRLSEPIDRVVLPDGLADGIYYVSGYVAGKRVLARVRVSSH